jgi:hypothetical protein
MDPHMSKDEAEFLLDHYKRFCFANNINASLETSIYSWFAKLKDEGLIAGNFTFRKVAQSSERFGRAQVKDLRRLLDMTGASVGISTDALAQWRDRKSLIFCSRVDDGETCGANKVALQMLREQKDCEQLSEFLADTPAHMGKLTEPVEVAAERIGRACKKGSEFSYNEDKLAAKPLSDQIVTHAAALIWTNGDEADIVTLYDPSFKTAPTMKVWGPKNETPIDRFKRVRKNAEIYFGRYLNLYWIYKVQANLNRPLPPMMGENNLRVGEDGRVIG